MERIYSWPKIGSLVVGKSTVVMGVLNVTPDSFSDGGKWNVPDKAMAHVRDMIQAGAHIIDVGAESTRPGSTPLTPEEECRRLLTFLPQVIQISSVPVSVDTYHWQTAEAAVKAGVHILNDVWGLQYDHGEMAEVAAASSLPLIVMHNHADEQYSGDIIDEIKKFLSRSIEIALSKGVKYENIILDPGIGFAKDARQNIEVIQRLGELTEFFPDLPWLLGVSRKRFIGEILQVPFEERDEGTGAASLYGVAKGMHIVRVHNVPTMVKMAKVWDVLAGKADLP